MPIQHLLEINTNVNRLSDRAIGYGIKGEDH